MASDLSRTEWFRVLSEYVKNALVERTQTRESALFSKCARGAACAPSLLKPCSHQPAAEPRRLHDAACPAREGASRTS
jgi:hypothetical protein